MFYRTCLAFAVVTTSNLSALPILWEGGTSSNLTLGGNWEGGSVPNQAGDVAQFDSTATIPFPTLGASSQQTLSLPNLLFPSANPQPYSFSISNQSLLIISCDIEGITNASGLTQQFTLNQSTLSIGSSGNSLNSEKVLINFNGTLVNPSVLNIEGSQVVLNINDTAGYSTINLIGGNLIVGSSNASSTYAGTVTGTSLGTLTKIGTGTLTLGGTNTVDNGWSTVLNQGTVSIAATANIGTGTLFFTPGTTGGSSSQLQVANGSLVSLTSPIQIGSGFTAQIDAQNGLQLSGGITDVTSGGNLYVTGPGTVYLQTSSSNTYTGQTTVDGASTLAAGNNNVFSPHSPHQVEGVLTLNNGSADFSNEILSLAGSGQVITGQVGTGSLSITGNSNTVFDGNFGGNGALILQGGTLSLIGDSSAYTGTTTVNSGAQLILNGALGGMTSIQGGQLSGSGTASRVTVGSGGMISPGNSIGTLSFSSYTQLPNSTYVVEINDAGQSDLISVSGTPGTALLSGGTVVVDPIGGINFGTPYTILTASGGVSGQFANVLSAYGSSLFTPVLNYSDPHAVFLIIESSLVNGAVSFNERQVASQLDALTAGHDPDPEINTLLSALVALSPTQITDALDQLTGDPHTKDPFIVATLNRQFIRRLYDPIRSIVTTSPFCRSVPDCSVIDVWVEGGWNRAFLRNDGNAFGLNLNGWEVTLGAQTTFCDTFTLGLAGSYEHDFVHYNMDGRGKLDTGFVGLYSLYRPEEFYILTDFAFGYTTNKIHRSIDIAPLNLLASSNTSTSVATFYGEVGFDLPASWVLVQPFIGIEAAGYWRSGVTESGGGDLDLILFKRERGSATGRLGLHLTTTQICSFSLSLDGAWNYRLTHDDYLYNEQFVGFGTPFAIEGNRLNRNSGEGAVTLTSQINPHVNLWAEFGGQIWRNGSNYFLTAGLITSF